MLGAADPGAFDKNAAGRPALSAKMGGKRLRTSGDLCVTRRDRQLFGEPCRAGDPLQRW